MWKTIIGSVISAITAIVVCMINANANHKKLISELEKHNDCQHRKRAGLQPDRAGQIRHRGAGSGATAYDTGGAVWQFE